jgi:regulator of sigma E protease
MEFLSDIWDLRLFVVPFLIVLTVLVFVHEMGHYLIAKRCGVKIEVFSVGFGKELFGWTDRTGTRWKFSLIPLGGYVKMFGDADVASRPSDNVSQDVNENAGPDEALHEGEGTGDWAEGKARPLTPEERAVSFHHKRLSQRVWIVAGGPLANFLFAFVALALLFGTVGQTPTPPVIGTVVEGSAAEAAGLLPGDRIDEINGKRIERFEQIIRVVVIGLDDELDMVILRDGESLPLK